MASRRRKSAGTVMLQPDRAEQLERRFEHLTGIAGALARFVDELTVGVVVLDGDGRALHVNRCAEALVARGDGMRLERNGRPGAISPDAAAALGELIASVLRASAPGAGGTVRVPRRGGHAAYCVLVAPPPAQDGGAGALLLIHDPDALVLPLPAMLRTLFNLTARESELVVALVAGTIIGSRSIQLIPAFYYSKGAEIFSTKAEYVRDVLLKPLITLSFVYLIGAAVARSRRMVPWAWATLAGGSMLALLVLGFVVVARVPIGALSESSARSFLSPTGLHANEIGVALVPLYAVALFMLPALATVRSRLAALAFAALALLAIGLTFSRAAFLAALLVSVVFAIKRRRAIWIIVGLAVVAAAVLLAPDPIKERVARGFDTASIGGRNSAADPLTAGRVGGIWKPLWPDIRGHALFGNGIHSTMWSSAARSGLIYVVHPHNAYIQLVMDYGVVFGAFVVVFLWRVWRLWRRLARAPAVPATLRGFFDGISVAFIAFLGQGLSGTSLVFQLDHAVYLCALGVALGVAARLSAGAEAGQPEAKQVRAGGLPAAAR